MLCVHSSADGAFVALRALCTVHQARRRGGSGGEVGNKQIDFTDFTLVHGLVGAGMAPDAPSR